MPSVAADSNEAAGEDGEERGGADILLARYRSPGHRNIDASDCIAGGGE